MAVKSIIIWVNYSNGLIHARKMIAPYRYILIQIGKAIYQIYLKLRK